jgi:hypothetical protein
VGLEQSKTASWARKQVDGKDLQVGLELNTICSGTSQDIPYYIEDFTYSDDEGWCTNCGYPRDPKKVQLIGCGLHDEEIQHYLGTLEEPDQIEMHKSKAVLCELWDNCPPNHSRRESS